MSSRRVPGRSSLGWLGRRHPLALLAGVIAVLTGVAVFAIATVLFPYHSSNHDEAVYLQQAAMLLAGQLELQAGELADAFRPWFFVQDGGRFYPKYAPVPAAMYAIAMALAGEPRLTLAAVAAGNVFLVYLLGAMTFDRRVGVLAASVFAASPLALVTTSVFLPYAPSTFLQLLFAVCYLRGVRDRSPAAGALAGIAIGLAFFARPFTAVLFAVPFVLHAVGQLLRAARATDRSGGRRTEPVKRHGATAIPGLAFVGVTLAYNRHLTGDAFTFPYEAFAPLDGPGFGRRELLGHTLEYTPALALEANGYVLWYFATRWFTAGAIGTGLAIGGLGYAVLKWERDGSIFDEPARDDGFERRAGLLLAGVLASVSGGNVLFWGNRNVLGTMTDPADGIIAQFGPVYHFDLLVPLSIFAAVGVLACWRGLDGTPIPAAGQDSTRTSRQVLLGLIVAGLLIGIVNAAVLAAPLERNAAYTDKHERVYEPFQDHQFTDALVFIPTPYGEWHHHPFQHLRNDPGFDGPVVYALDRAPAADFQVIDAYPDRSLYRFTYHGTWTPNPNRHVTPKLEPLHVVRSQTLRGETRVGVPGNVAGATVRIENGDGDYGRYTVDRPDEDLTVHWTVNTSAATVRDGRSSATVPVSGTGTMTVLITLAQPDGSTLTYRQELGLRGGGSHVEAIWPPDRYVCHLVTDCGNEGTYVPAAADAHLDGVSFETAIESRDADPD